MSKKFDADAIKKAATEAIEKMKNTKNSTFLDDLYGNPAKYNKFRAAIDQMVLEVARQKQIDKIEYGFYSKPLGFQKPMILSPTEEKVIAAAVLDMSRAIHEHKYIIAPSTDIQRFEVSDNDQRDVPIPYITIHIKCPKDVAPKHGFYLRGTFKKEKILKEIVYARIDRITYITENGKEISLLCF